MTIRTPLLGSLSQRLGQSGSSETGLPYNLTQPKFADRELEVGIKAPPSLNTIDELTRNYSYEAQTLTWVAQVLPRTNEPYFFLYKRPEFPSDVSQFGGLGAEKPAFVGISTKTSPYRGRITGPVKFVNQLLTTWRLEPDSACALLGFETSRFADVHNVLQGYETLTGRDAKDRIAHLFQIRKLLSALFQNETVENEWLREPHDTLNGRVPMDLLLEGSMENLLLVREYVELVTGR